MCPPGRALVQVVVSPWATVHVDGQHAGEGPGAFSVPVGEHIVRLTNAESKIDYSTRVGLTQSQRAVVRPSP